MISLKRQLRRNLVDLPRSDCEDTQHHPCYAYVTVYASDADEPAEFYEAIFSFNHRYESSATLRPFAGTLGLAPTEDQRVTKSCGLGTSAGYFFQIAKHQRRSSRAAVKRFCDAVDRFDLARVSSCAKLCMF